MPAPAPPSTAHADYLSLHQQLSQIIKGQETTLHFILSAYFTGQHVLLEDYPGTGKTTLAKEIGRHIEGALSKRVQFTPDLLPSDLTGVNIFNPAERDFVFQQGPLFCNILLADEINRASPRTQSALLEAMAERQVTIEGTTYPLPASFFVIATQNPAQFKGTYQLPEAQMDRFGLLCSLGYLDHDNERAILDRELGAASQTTTVPPSPLSTASYAAITEQIRQIHLSEELKDYLVRLVAATRTDPDVLLPLSPRATLTLAKLSQAYAFALGKEFVTASLIQELAPAALAHRLMLSATHKNNTAGKQHYLRSLLERIAV